MNHEQPLASPEPSDSELDDALRRLQDDTDKTDALLAEQRRKTIIGERLVMDAFHIAGLPVELLEESRATLGPDTPIEATIEMLLELQPLASMQDDPEAEQAIQATLYIGLIVEQIAANKILHDTLDPASAAEVRKEEQLYFLNDNTLSANNREKVLRAINLLYEDGSGLDMGNPQTLIAAEEHRELESQIDAIKEGSRVIRETLTAIATDYMRTQGVIEHDDKDDFVSGVVVAISREYAVMSGLVAVDQLAAEASIQAAAIRLDLSRSEALRMGWTDQQFDELIARLRSGSTAQ